MTKTARLSIITMVPDGLGERLEDFFRRIMPDEAMTVEDAVTWIEALLGPDLNTPIDVHDALSMDADYDSGDIEEDKSLSFFIRLRQNQKIMVRDLYALHAFRQCLKELINSRELIQATVSTIAVGCVYGWLTTGHR